MNCEFLSLQHYRFCFLYACCPSRQHVLDTDPRFVCAVVAYTLLILWYRSDEDYKRFRKVAIRPPSPSLDRRNRLVIPVQRDNATKSTTTVATQAASMADRKETQTNLLLQFFRALQRCKGEKDTHEKGAEGAKRESLDLEFGVWTGLSNEVWQVSLGGHS